MAGSALKRLMAEHRQLMKNPPEGIVAGPKSDDNYFEWEANILGPPDTCFEFGVFKASLTFPKDYPMSPPKMKFLSDICHPNVYADGRVCISILHPPGDDPMGYESATERWSPVQNVEKILLSVMSMLAEPNCESAANVDAAKLWRDQRASFLHRAKQSVKASLNLMNNARIPPIKSDAELEKIILDESMPLIFEGLNLLLDKKPKDGMEFLADFFQSKVKPDPMLSPKKKKKSTSLVAKSNADLDEIIRSHHLSASTIQSFFSVDQEERSRAGLAILTSENQKLVEEICDRLTNE